MTAYGMILVVERRDDGSIVRVGTRPIATAARNALAFFNPFGPVVNGRRLRLFEWAA